MTVEDRVRRMIKLSSSILDKQIEFQQHKDAILHESVGRHGLALVYRVRRAIIPEHTRTGYRAVRVKVRKG